MNHRRNGLRKLITEAKGGPGNLVERGSKENTPEGRAWGKVRECSGERATRLLRVGTLGEVPREDLKRIFITYGVSFKVMVSTDRLVPGRGYPIQLGLLV